MLNQNEIVNFCSQHNYDLRISGNGRWIDQKCTSDVISIVADCIYNYNLENPNISFTTKDIWHYSYSIENIESIFKKPKVENSFAKNEYNKFFQPPMEMLANANLLTKIKKRNRNFYEINNINILEYIALREKNALFFLKTYIEKVLHDTNLWCYFDDFFTNPCKKTYKSIKINFSDFTIKHTKINGKVECNRIFNKILNPLAYFRNTQGTKKGRLSEQIITYDMLMYNRNNFRDIYANKPKGVTRKEYLETNPIIVNDAYYKYQSVKAKRFLRIFNDQVRSGQTEHLDGIHINDKAVNIHHIFPEADYPEISFYLENLIAITPTQHFNYAHPNARTQEIDEQYQHLLLLSKVDRIQENLSSISNEKIYEFSNLLFVLNSGFDEDSIMEIYDMDFFGIVNRIDMHYRA